MMLANLDLFISGVAVVAVVASQPMRICCADLLLFFSAIAVYVLLSRHFKRKGRPSAHCKESIAELEQEHFAEHEQCEASAFSSNSDSDVVVESDPQQTYVSEQISKMKKEASVRNIAGTMRIFRSLQQSGNAMSSVMYNTVLAAWINSGNIQAAQDWMEQIREAGMADIVSFNALIQALVKSRALDDARVLLEQMRMADIEPTIVTFNALLSGCAQENRFHEGLSFMEEMHRQGVKPSTLALDSIVNLINGCRGYDESSARVRRILRKFQLDNAQSDWSALSLLPVSVPYLVATLARADASQSSLCRHEVRIAGSRPQVKTARRMLKQYGFLDRAEDCEAWPLDGHWETDHGLTVVIEGKLVRWSRQRASRLQFAGADRRSCVLTLYGAATQGQLVTPGMSPGAVKSLRWDNGDVWNLFEGRVIGQGTMFSQTMTKVVRDDTQDQAYRSRSESMLRCVSRNGICLPSTIESTVLQFLGSDLFYVQVCFERKYQHGEAYDDDQDADVFDAISRRNPLVGIRHCLAEPGTGCYGQRTLLNGDEVDEQCFNRHVKFVWRT
jgi:pentatricopeptide repeat protein